MQIILEKLSDNVGGLRTNQIEGFCAALPKVGHTFLMTAPPLEAGNMRVIETSPVVEVTDLEGVIEFKTQNSSYQLIVL